MLIPDILKKAEFALIRFSLEFQEPFTLTQEMLLRLRRELSRIDRHLSETQEMCPDRLTLSSLLNPPLPSDPIALKRYQKFAPPFVLFPPEGLPEELQPGDEIALPVLFLGKGVQAIPVFLKTLQMLGISGVYCGTGPFHLLSVEASDFSGKYSTIWTDRDDPWAIAPPLIDLFWYLESSRKKSDKIRLSFDTPTRLMTHGRPLFHPHFTHLFPFLLRRVSSMLFAHCGLEVFDSPKDTLQLLSYISEIDNQLTWRDWKSYDTNGRSQELGGFTGSLDLSGEGLLSLCWILKAGALMNLGKGAAFGNGHFTIETL